MKNKIIIAHNFFIIICLGVTLIAGACSGQKSNINENYSWVNKIQNDHPRLFFNKDSFKEIKERALNDEREIFEEMKNRVDELIDKKIEFKDPLVPDGTQNSDHMYGT